MEKSILGFIWINKPAYRNDETACLWCRIKKKTVMLGAQITGRQTRGRE